MSQQLDSRLSDTAAAAPASTAPHGYFRYCILAVVVAATVLNYADRSTLSIAGTSIQKDLGLDPASPLPADLVAWTRERLDGRPQPPGCETIER